METLERRLDIAREEAARYKKAARLWKTRFEQEQRARCVCVCDDVRVWRVRISRPEQEWTRYSQSSDHHSHHDHLQSQNDYLA